MSQMMGGLGGGVPGQPDQPGGPPASMENLLQVGVVKIVLVSDLLFLYFRLGNSWPSRCSRVTPSWWSS